MGTTNNLLESSVAQKLIAQFQRIENIEEVYQYGQTMNDVFSIVLGIKLQEYSDKEKEAAINAIKTALKGEEIKHVIDVSFIEDEEDSLAIQKVGSTLVYKKGV